MNVTTHHYNHYSTYLQQLYNGEKVYKIVVDGSFTCPNRDGSKGYGGCSYCNTDSFTPLSRKLPSISEQVHHGIRNAAKKYGAEKFIIYFQPNSNTYAETKILRKIYDEALGVSPQNTVGLSVGTRPDCMDREKVALLEEYSATGLNVDLELGIESVYNKTLSLLNRGCSHEDFLNVMQLLRNSTLNVCVHVILGLPGETKEMMLAIPDEINKFDKIKFVKFHNLHIVEGSIMGVHYKRKPFPLLKLGDYVDLLCQLIPKLRPDIIIQRLFAVSDENTLIAPRWNLKKSQLQNFIEREIRNQNVVQGSSYKAVTEL